jgi:pimeloyl-ACP methyl ester carboxylesterase
MLRYLDIDGHRLAALALDEDLPGEPTVLLHGITHSLLLWAPDRLFRGRGPVYSLSLPDHFPAASPPAARPLSADVYADLLIEAVGRLTGGRPATIGGVSTGGFAALAIAARAPGLVRRVVCISGFAQGRWTGGFGLLQDLARGGPLGRAIFAWVSRALTRNPAMTLVGWRMAAPGYRLSAFAGYPHFDEIVCAMAPGYFHLDLEAMQSAYAAFPDIDIRSWLPLIAAPTLVACGGSDPIVPPAQGRLIAASVQQSELRIYPGAGHVPHIERFAEFGRDLADWMARNP